MCFGQKGKNTTTAKQKIKHKKHLPGPFTPKADAVPLHHRVN